MSVLQWLKKENVIGLLDHDKEQSMEMKTVVAAANDTVRPARRVLSKKVRQRVITTEMGNKLLNVINWKICKVKMQRIFYMRRSQNYDSVKMVFYSNQSCAI